MRRRRALADRIERLRGQVQTLFHVTDRLSDESDISIAEIRTLWKHVDDLRDELEAVLESKIAYGKIVSDELSEHHDRLAVLEAVVLSPYSNGRATAVTRALRDPVDGHPEVNETFEEVGGHAA